MHFSILSDLKKTTAVVESLSTTSTGCSVTEITSLLQDSTNRIRNLHQIILQEYGLEVQHLFRDWERLWLRASDYKNHRIFTLRSLHKELIPVSIKLKSTLKTETAKKIIRKAEKDLLQARIKAINSILDNIAKQTELCRSQLASIISPQRLRKCQGFIDKVGEIRFTKIKQRQLNKFDNLQNKKEGNLTRANSPNLAFQAGRQALLPPGEGNNLAAQATQSGRQAGTLLPHEEGSYLSQAGAPLPLGEASSLSQAGSQAGLLLPLGEGSYLSQAGSQAGAPLPLGEGSIVSQAGSQVVTSQAGTQLPSREASNLSQAGSQAGSHLPPREGSSLAAGSQASQASQVADRLVTPPSPEEGGSPAASPASQAGNHLPPAMGNSSQAGQSGSQGTRSGRHSARQRHSNLTPHPPNRLLQGSSPEDPNPKWVITLSNKPLTPAQRSVLAKGPNFCGKPQATP